MNIRLELEYEIRDILSLSISDDYINDILNSTDDNGNNKLLDMIIDNVLETSGYYDEGCWNEDDIKLAIGRELIDRMNIIW